MSLAADVAIAAAERIEKTAGASAGLAVFRRLASNAGGAELRGRAILGGLRCAIPLRDLATIRDLSLLWQTVDQGVWDGVYALCKDLWRAGLGVCATDLANSEVRRARSAKALYAYARCLDVAGDMRAGAAFGEAILQAEKEGAPAMLRTARVRRASWLARSPETLAKAIEEAKLVVPAEVTAAERLALARVLLRSPSRFVRAGAISMLDELAADQASRRDPKIAARALRLAARHADELAEALTSLEVDRLRATFGREALAKAGAEARAAIGALEELARAKSKQGPESEAALEGALAEAARTVPELASLHLRAREILAGRFEAHHAAALERAASAAPRAGATLAMWTPMLDSVVAMRDSAWARASRSMRALAEYAESGERLPAQAWTIAQAALGTEDAELRGVAGRLVAAMLKSTAAAPPRGWLGLATSLAACGMEELATHPRRAAALAKEPGAEEALGVALTRSAWQLAREGERSRAIARLREAKQIAREKAKAR